jgi:hypothetical protein
LDPRLKTEEKWKKFVYQKIVTKPSKMYGAGNRGQRSGIRDPGVKKGTESSSVADLDPGSSAFLTPGSGIRNGFFWIPDLGSRIPNPYFLELSDNFLGKKFYNS